MSEGEEPHSILSLDANKAFDRVEWGFMMEVLERMNFGDFFLNGIRTLYNDPRARIYISNNLAESFILNRGTRQGCPLSQSLFSIVIEPLAQLISETKIFEGFGVNGVREKILLYADDVLLFVKKPTEKIKLIMELLEEFGSYKINWSKNDWISDTFLKGIEREINELIWGRGRVRIKQGYLNLQIKNGGLGIPNFLKE